MKLTLETAAKIQLHINQFDKFLGHIPGHIGFKVVDVHTLAHILAKHDLEEFLVEIYRLFKEIESTPE